MTDRWRVDVPSEGWAFALKRFLADVEHLPTSERAHASAWAQGVADGRRLERDRLAGWLAAPSTIEHMTAALGVDSRLRARERAIEALAALQPLWQVGLDDGEQGALGDAPGVK